MANKSLILLAVFFVAIMGAAAQQGEVMVINFNYDNGLIRVKDRTIMLGYYFANRNLYDIYGWERQRSDWGKFLSRLLVWLIVVVLFTFICGQLSSWIPTVIAPADTRSRLRADYGLWPYSVIQPVDVAIVDDILQDVGITPDEIILSGDYWEGISFPY